MSENVRKIGGSLHREHVKRRKFFRAGKVLVATCVSILLAAAIVCVEPSSNETLIDVNSGRVMIRHYVLGIRMTKRIQETPFSLLVRQYSLASVPANWRYAQRASRGSLITGDGIAYSSGIYGDAIAMCENMAKLLDGQNCDEQVRRAEVTLFLNLLKEGPSREMLRKMHAEIAELVPDDR
jgi:hypothetical protein